MKINRDEIIDKFGGRCGYCGCGITLKTMQVDHMKPKWCGGGNEFDNLMPSCRQCNHYKREKNLEQFRASMLTLHERLHKIYILRVAVNFGMSTINPFKGTFYFESLTPKTH